MPEATPTRRSVIVPLDEPGDGPTMGIEEASVRYAFPLTRLRRRVSTGGVPGAFQGDDGRWRVPVESLERLGYRSVSSDELAPLEASDEATSPVGASEPAESEAFVEMAAPSPTLQEEVDPELRRQLVAEIRRDLVDEIRSYLADEMRAVDGEWRTIVAELRSQLAEERRGLGVILELLERQLELMESRTPPAG